MKTRVATATILILLSIVSSFLEETVFNTVSFLLAFIALWETMDKIDKGWVRGGKFRTLTVVAALLFFLYASFALAFALPLLRWHNPVVVNIWILVLPPIGRWLIISIVSTVVYDTAAFLIGQRFGKRRFENSSFVFLRVSPKKSWEGSLGALLISVPVVVFLSGNLLSLGLAFSVLLGIALGMAAFFGDLIESGLKRLLGTKDMGNLLPGHGGLLDRLDSHMMSMVVTITILLIIRE
ncbi:MAG: phosphatidate cytidylyltransferase [Patescibacteria group bacterium]|nr:phosphatidate cytidylyltransferase [Patescibacteria group bacterium]